VAVVVGQRHPDRRAVEGAPEELLGGGELGDRALARGDIADRGRDEQAVVGLQRAEADLHRELGAPLLAPEELQARAHRPRGRVAHVALHELAGLAAQALGDELGDALPDDLAAAIAEQQLRLRVDERNVPAR
jgi:hypothetical protein